MTHAVASYLELMQQPYTGCNPIGLMLSKDKAIAKESVLPSNSYSAVRCLSTREACQTATASAVPPAGQVGGRGCVAGHLASVDCQRRSSPGPTRGVRSPACRLRCDGGTVHRRPRTVRGCDRKPASGDVSDLGDDLQQDAGRRGTNCHREGQMGPGIPEKARYRHTCRNQSPPPGWTFALSNSASGCTVP